METSNSGAKYVVLHAENHRRSVGLIGTCNFCPKVAVLNAHNHR